MLLILRILNNFFLNIYKSRCLKFKHAYPIVLKLCKFDLKLASFII